MAYHQAAHPAHATGHHAVATGALCQRFFHWMGLSIVGLIIARPSSSAHQPKTTDNSPFATISPSTHTVPPMQAICPTSVSFLVSMRSSCPGVTGLRNLKRFTAASSATPPLLLAATCGVGRSQHHSGGLSHRFDQKNPRQNRLGRKMPGKNWVRRIDKLHRNTTNSRLQFFHPVDPQEWRAMRNQRLDFTSLDHPGIDHCGLYTSNVSGGIFGFIELTSMTNTLFTPLLPSTSSDRA